MKPLPSEFTLHLVQSILKFSRGIPLADATIFITSISIVPKCLSLIVESVYSIPVPYTCHTTPMLTLYGSNILYAYYISFSVGSGVMPKATYEQATIIFFAFLTPNISAYSNGTDIILYVLTNVSTHCWENTSNPL